MTECVDFIVIGGGVAGLSCAAELSRHGRVLVLEQEAHIGYHSSGRSAAFYSKCYGSVALRTLTLASEPAFLRPDPEYWDAPLVRERGHLLIARADQRAVLDAAEEEAAGLATRLSGPDAVRLVPILRGDYVASALVIRDGGDIDVHAMMSGYRRQLRSFGGTLQVNTRVLSIESEGAGLAVTTSSGRILAPIVVNATGAWAGHVAIAAGLDGPNLTPCRRTACIIPCSPDSNTWPLTICVEESFYFKPEATGLMLSPCDETPVAAGDAYPEDDDVALAVERFERATHVEVMRVTHYWAGLRTFTADREPIIGFDPRLHGFFWLAGQGGAGVQGAPGTAALASQLITGRRASLDLGDIGAVASRLAPERLLANP